MEVAAILAIILLDFPDFALILGLLVMNATISYREEASADKVCISDFLNFNFMSHLGFHHCEIVRCMFGTPVLLLSVLVFSAVLRCVKRGAVTLHAGDQSSHSSSCTKSEGHP